MLRVIVETELSLGEPDVDQGLVTWFDVRIVAGHGDEDIEIGQARVARIHMGEASIRGEALYDVLDADCGELEALYDVSSRRTGSEINSRWEPEAICSS